MGRRGYPDDGDVNPSQLSPRDSAKLMAPFPSSSFAAQQAMDNDQSSQSKAMISAANGGQQTVDNRGAVEGDLEGSSDFIAAVTPSKTCLLPRECNKLPEHDIEVDSTPPVPQTILREQSYQNTIPPPPGAYSVSSGSVQPRVRGGIGTFTDMDSVAGTLTQASDRGGTVQNSSTIPLGDEQAIVATVVRNDHAHDDHSHKRKFSPKLGWGDLLGDRRIQILITACLLVIIGLLVGFVLMLLDKKDVNERPRVTTSEPPDRGTCGDGDVGNGYCRNHAFCCSKYGYCGTGEDYCDGTLATRPPTPSPTPLPPSTGPIYGTCGDGDVGNGYCRDPAFCCSKYGYCGTGEDHCDGTFATRAPSPLPTPMPRPAEPGTCGDGDVGNGRCPDTGLCCSQYGYCGTGEGYCNGSFPASAPSTGSPAAGTCGGGDLGDGICADATLCCSEFGYCGTGVEFCGAASPAGTCGEGNVGNGSCADAALCCSEFGFCGTGEEFCGGVAAGESLGPCGDGNVGNGSCADATLCCSQFGFCGTGEEFCGGVFSSPSSPPQPSPAS